MIDKLIDYLETGKVMIFEVVYGKNLLKILKYQTSGVKSYFI